MNGVKVPYKFTEKREGDVAISYADVQFAKSYLGWKANFDLEEMCRDGWAWQQANPMGYRQQT